MKYPFKPDQFTSHHEYNVHSDKLSRAQSTARKVCGVIADEQGLVRSCRSYQIALLELIDMATQIGYEQAINKKHRATDYGLTEDLVELLPNKCDFCANQYFVYGCEERCANAEKDEACRITIKECID